MHNEVKNDLQKKIYHNEKLKYDNIKNYLKLNILQNCKFSIKNSIKLIKIKSIS